MRSAVKRVKVLRIEPSWEVYRVEFGLGERGAGRLLEVLEALAFDIAAVEGAVELAKRGPGVGRFEIVFRIEHGAVVAHRGL